jgi:DNA-binding CsgD family transcriptional regulator
MSEGNNSLTFSKMNHPEIIRNEMNIKAFHYERAIEGKVKDQNPLLIFESCIIDLSGKQFACDHSHCRENQECIHKGKAEDNFGFHELRVHPDDRKLWCNEVFPDILKFINESHAKDLSSYRFIFNHRYIHRDESISQFMHEGAINLIQGQSIPSMKLKAFAEIGDFKTDETMILTIFIYNTDWGYRKVFRKVYGAKYPNELSLREMEIVKLCQEGYSGKMIAEKLNLSIHTVKNHKRNCMEKTMTHNITELIHVCIQHGWL